MLQPAPLETQSDIAPQANDDVSIELPLADIPPLAARPLDSELREQLAGELARRIEGDSHQITARRLVEAESELTLLRAVAEAADLYYTADGHDENVAAYYCLRKSLDAWKAGAK